MNARGNNAVEVSECLEQSVSRNGDSRMGRWHKLCDMSIGIVAQRASNVL